MHPRRQRKFHMLPRTLKRHLVRRILGTKLLRAPRWSRSPIKEGEIRQEDKTPAQDGSPSEVAVKDLRTQVKKELTLPED